MIHDRAQPIHAHCSLTGRANVYAPSSPPRDQGQGKAVLRALELCVGQLAPAREHLWLVLCFNGPLPPAGCAVLAHCPECITRLEMMDCMDVGPLHALAACTALQDLSLGTGTVTGAESLSTAGLSEALANTDALTALRWCHFGEAEPLSGVHAAIGRLPRLQRLALKADAANEADLAHITCASALTRLSLGYEGFPCKTSGLREAEMALARAQFSRLRVLALSMFDYSGIEELKLSFPEMPRLRELFLGNVCFSAGGTEALRACSCLTWLWVEGKNETHGAPDPALLAVVASLVQLQHLRMHNMHLSLIHI